MPPLIKEYNNTNQQSKRTPEEITFAILTVADCNSCNDNNRMVGRATKMKIMADAFISSERATEYLDKLESEGLIEYRADTNSYKTTERGKCLLQGSKCQ